MKREIPRRIGTARVPKTMRSFLVVFVLTLIAVHSRAQTTDQLAELWANNRLQSKQLQYEKQAGPLRRDFFDREMKNQQEWSQIEQLLTRLTPEVHEQVRAKANNIYNQRILDIGPGGTQGRRDETGKVSNPPEPPPGSQSLSPSLLRYWWALVIPAGGAGGYFLWTRRPRQKRSAGSGTPPPGLRPPPQPAQVPLQSTRPQPAGAAATAPAAAPASIPSVSASAADSAAPGATPRERILAQVKSKYQASISAAMDALTETQLELQQNAAVPETIRSELRRIGGQIYETIEGLLRKHASNPRKAIADAALLRPIFRGLRERALGRLLRRITIIGLVVWVARLVLTTQVAAWSQLPFVVIGRVIHSLAPFVPPLLLIYACAVPLVFFLSYRGQAKGALGTLDKSAAALKAPRLLYTYANQVPAGIPGKLTCQILRISGATGQKAVDDQQITDQPDASGLGSFALSIDNVATYLKPPGGTLTLLSAVPGNLLMSQFGAIVTDVVTQYAAELEPLFEALGRFGDLKWRERVQSADIPRAERLLANVSQLEKIWRPVYVADNVFDFLIKRIDLFNMRESATPNGILLCGPPGNGKELLARKIAESGFAQFVKPTADQLASPQNIKNLWAAQAARAPVVLFVEYADQVFAPAGEQDGAGRDATLAWLEEWSRHEPCKTGMWIVMSSQSEEKLHPRILAKFGGSKIGIKPPDAAGRVLVLGNATREMQLPGTAPRWLIDATDGVSVRDLYALVGEVRTESGLGAPTDAHWRTAAEPLIGRQPLTGEQLDKVWNEIVLKPDVKTEILDKIDMFARGDKAAPRGMLLYGPSGTGKTLIAERVAESAGCKFLPMTIADLKGQYIGHCAALVRKKWEEARRYRRCVMFIDECEGVFARRGGTNTDSFAEELVQAFLAEWDGFGTKEQKVWVIGATNKRDLLDEAIVSRFESTIEIGQPGPQERMQILALEIKKLGRAIEIPAFVGAATTGRSGRNLASLARAICTRADKQGGVANEDMWREVIFQGKGGRRGGDTWDKLILAPQTLSQLKTVSKSLQSLESLRKQGVPLPKGALLYGPPGTGKTQVAKTLANESGLPLIAPTTSEFKAGYLGQAGQKTREVFERARGVAPCILFIDEIDAVCPARGGGSGDVLTEEIVNQILQETEGANAGAQCIYLLGATNRLESVDPAIRSRLKSTIEIPLPNEAERREMLKVFLRKDNMKVDFDIDAAAAEVAHGTKKLAGRALLGLLERASQRSVDRAFADGTTENVVLTLDDLRAELQPQGRMPGPNELRKIWDQIVLKPEVKSEVLDKIGMFARGDKAAPRGMLLYGPPGTGKTEIAGRIADSAGCKFLPLKSSDLKAGYIGQSGQFVKKKWDEARSHDSCVMFIDECEGVFARRGGTNTDSASEELVQAFLSEWDGFGTEDQRVWVIGATNRRDVLDEAIVSRFGAMIEIGLPGSAERAQILALEMKKLERPFEIPPFVGPQTTGMSGRILAELAREVCTQAGKHGGVAGEDIWRAAIKRLRNPEGGSSEDEPDTWDKLILGPQTLNQLMTVSRSLQNLEDLRSQGVPLPKGALLYGPPGTGKTQIAKTLAHESGLPLIAPTSSEFKGGYLGHAGQKTREVFARARGMAPCILFIDEIDAVCPGRDGGRGDVLADEIVNQILQETEGVKAGRQYIYLLGATNRPEAVDSAIRSRLKTTIEVPLPDKDGRRQLLSVFLRKNRLKVDFDVDAIASELAELTPNLGGRALVGLVERASQRSVERAFATGTPRDVVLTRGDLMQEVRPEAKQLGTQELEIIWSQIVLNPGVKTEVLEKTALFARGDKAAPRGMLLYGPPGTGKTLIAERIAESAGCKFMPMTVSDLKGQYVGASAALVKNKWEEARSYPRCVMFIDECEGVFARRGGTNADSGSQELVQAFLAEWDGFGTKEQKVWVIGATNRRDILDEAIVQRFGATIEVGQPGAAERAQILRVELKKLERDIEVPAFVGSETNGLSGRQLATVARELCAQADKQGGAASETAWREVISRLATVGNTPVKKGSRWESLVLSDDLLEKLRTLCDTLRHAEDYKEQGFDVPTGALLYGPPGTGKTEIASTLANESGLSFVAASTADLKAGFTGQSGQKTRELFERARGTAPCILFIDEIDAVCPTRGGRAADTFTDEIVVQMLQEMNGVKTSPQHVFVLAATNLPDAIDPAIKSRFEEQIQIDYPDGPQRQRLFKNMIGKLPVDFDRDAIAAELAGLTPNLGGRDIQSIIRRASQRAVRRSGGIAKAAMLTRADLIGEVRTAPPP